MVCWIDFVPATYSDTTCGFVWFRVASCHIILSSQLIESKLQKNTHVFYLVEYDNFLVTEKKNMNIPSYCINMYQCSAIVCLISHSEIMSYASKS